MTTFARLLLAPALLAASVGCACAQDNLSWNLALTSDYVFRGVSQSDRGPALQGGLDYAFGDSGFYVGGWASNVDFGPGSPDVELDTYVGWSRDVAEAWNVDLQLVRYNYLGESDAFGSVEYNELIGAFTWNEMITLTAAWTDDYGNSGIDSTYLAVAGEWGLGETWTLDAAVGNSSFDGGGDYVDWQIGVGRAFGPVDARISYHDTDIDTRVSDAVVLTLSLGD